MSNDGFRLLMSATPLWQNAAPSHPLPVHVRTVYTVMGRNGARWQTIVGSTEDLYQARLAMDTANESGTFERLVIATGKSINRAPASQWTTIECALPKAISHFQQLFSQLEQQTANLNPQEKLARMPGAVMLGHKKSQRFLLALAVVLATLDKNIGALSLIAMLALCDVLFLLDARPISARQAHWFNNGRNWGYALLNGYLLYYLLT
jgi:hypothetical protein